MLKRSAVVIFTLFLLFNTAKADHTIAADLSYKCISQGFSEDQYQITMTLYRDCAGIDFSTSYTIMVRGCGHTYFVSLAKQGGIKELSLGCIGSPSTCKNGLYYGVEYQTFSGSVTIQKCYSWVFANYICCRNKSVTTIASPWNNSFYAETTLDNTTYCNNSIVFSSPPVLMICPGVESTHLIIGTDADGDTLTYEYSCPQGDANQCLQYLSSYSYSSFLDGYTQINKNALTLLSNSQMISPFCVMVKEYRNGAVIASTERNMQVIVINSSCCQPLPIELLDFSAKLVNGEVQLSWSTASETNNEYFDVLKATIDQTYESVCRTSGAGNSSSTNNYSCSDNSPSVTNCYRIKQVDFNGNYTYSDWIVVIDRARVVSVEQGKYDIISRQLRK